MGDLPISQTHSVADPAREQTRTLIGRACAGAAALLFLSLAISFSLTRGPWWDEGLFADVAVNFKNSGHLRSSVLAPFSFDNLPAVHQYMYWQLPGYLVALGLWFRVTAVSVLSMRLFSTLWGCIFIASWFFFVKGVSRNQRFALAVSSVVALDYSCVAASSEGRMDMMCAALGQAALAAYVGLRAKHKNCALLLAGLLGAAAGFSHPMGAIPNICLVYLLLLDWRKLSWSSVSLFLLPYLVFAAFWLRYILQAPDIFFAQARNVSAYRVGGLFFVFKNIANDVGTRYLQFFFAPHAGLHKLKIFCLLFGACGLVAILTNRKTRSQPLTRTLIVFLCVGYVGVAAIDDLKYPYYFIYVTPILSAYGAAWLYDSFALQKRLRWLSSALLAAYVAATVANTAYYVRRNDLEHEYQPTVQAVRSLSRPGAVIMGPSELAFALGFAPPLIDDCTLGFTSGIEPQVFVMYPACRIPGYSPFIWEWSSKKLASDYHRVLERGGYEVYARNKQ